MPIGTDRQSFAFNTPAPVVQRPQSSGQSRAAQLVGGQSQGGAVTSGPQTDAGPIAGGLGAFVEQIMEPHVKQRQTEEFFRGFTKAQAGQATEELAKSNGGFNKIFGPTSFVEGAAFYTAKQAVDKWQADRLDELDTLKRMPPDEASKVLAKASTDLMTGTPAVDSLIQQQLVQVSGPLMDTVAKARRVQEQENGRQATSASIDTSGVSYAKVAAEQATLSDPADADPRAVLNARDYFVQGLAKPFGMTDETYRETINSAANNFLANNNLFAFRAMKDSGLLRSGGILNDDQLAALEAKVHTAADRALALAAAAPDIAAATEMVYADVQSGRIRSPMEASKRLMAINATVASRTGAEELLFDHTAITSVGNSVTDALVSASRRREEREQQLADRQATWAHEEWVKDRDRAQETAQVVSAMSTGSAATAIAKGLGEEKHYVSLATNAWANGDMALLAKNFVGDGIMAGFVARPVATSAQAMIAAYGEKYTKGFEVPYQRWKALDKLSPGAAAAYFGEYNVKLKLFDNLISNGVPQVVAYERALSPTSDFGAGSLPPEKRKALREAVDKSVSGMSGSGWNPFSSKYRLNASARNVIADTIGNDAVPYLAHTGMSPEAAVGMLAPAARSAGHYETAGSFGWHNDRNTVPLARLLKAQQPEIDRAFMTLADRRLKAAGFAAGASADDYTVQRFGNEGVYVLAASPDGSEFRHVLLTTRDIKAELDGHAAAELKANNPSTAEFAARAAAKAGLPADRHIDGETGWQRTRRIQLETRAAFRTTPARPVPAGVKAIGNVLSTAAAMTPGSIAASVTLATGKALGKRIEASAERRAKRHNKN